MYTSVLTLRSYADVNTLNFKRAPSSNNRTVVPRKREAIVTIYQIFHQNTSYLFFLYLDLLLICLRAPFPWISGQITNSSLLISVDVNTPEEETLFHRKTTNYSKVISISANYS